MKTILVGAVAYDPRVVTIWDIIKDFFIAEGCPTDYVLYSNYALLQDALVRGDIDIAFEFYAALQGPIADKKIVVLATTGATRQATTAERRTGSAYHWGP